MMSSATSTSEEVGRSNVRVSSETTSTPSTFRASHFFVLASLTAATGAVMMSRQSSPAHLVLISVTIATAGLAAAGFYRMLAPLVSDSATAAPEPLSERARAVLEREKALALRALKELEFDRSMGKVSQSDFDEMAGRLRARALSLMKQLDEDSLGYRATIEREVTARLAARRTDRSEPVPATPAIAVAAACSCGTQNDSDAVFCKKCGTKLGFPPAADTNHQSR
jgi:hypothetical protein